MLILFYINETTVPVPTQSHVKHSLSEAEDIQHQPGCQCQSPPVSSAHRQPTAIIEENLVLEIPQTPPSTRTSEVSPVSTQPLATSVIEASDIPQELVQGLLRLVRQLTSQLPNTLSNEG